MKVMFEVEESGYDDSVNEAKEKDLVAQFVKFIKVRCGIAFQVLVFHHGRKCGCFWELHLWLGYFVNSIICTVVHKEGYKYMDTCVNIVRYD